MPLNRVLPFFKLESSSRLYGPLPNHGQQKMAVLCVAGLHPMEPVSTLAVMAATLDQHAGQSAQILRACVKQ